MKCDLKKYVFRIIALIISTMLMFSLCGCKKKEKSVSNLGMITSNNDLRAIVSKVYNKVDKSKLPNTETIDLNINNKDELKLYTGLENGSDIEFAVVSKPLMNNDPYEFAIFSVKENVDVSAFSKRINDNANMKRWESTEAEKICITTSGNIVCLIMANDDTAKSVFESFKSLAGDTKNDIIRTVYM